MFFRFLAGAILLFSSPLDSAIARRSGPETEAIYIVPTSPELVSHSRFVIDIVDPFVDENTRKISYRFPEILVGEANKLIELTRAPNTVNSWTSEIMDCHCTIIDSDNFSCNVHLKGPSTTLSEANLVETETPGGELSLAKSLAHLESLPLSDEEKTAYRGVIRSFFSGEPAGIFTYELR